MKTIVLALGFLLLSFSEAMACDICGCGAGSSYIGLLPDFSKNIAGLRYRYNNIQTHLGVGGSRTHLTTDEWYRTVEFWGATTIRKKIRLMYALPVGFNSREKQHQRFNSNGIGDVQLNAFYNLLQKKAAVGTTRLLVQSLWLGAGIKLPTGKYIAANRTEASTDPNVFQLGSGSTDFMLNGMYDIRLQDLGMSVQASYRMNTANKFEYQYGNKFSLNTQLYHKFRINKNWLISPNTGIQWESSQTDLDQNFKVNVSGGNMTLFTLGTELNYRTMMLGANWQVPIQQNLANGFIESGNKAMVHLSFLF